MKEGTSLGYRPALDGIRGLAIAMVVGFHALGWPHSGWLGVDLFFVLSGFLITSLLLEEHAASGRIDIRSFYRRRARRLLPALFVLLLPYVLVAVSALAVGKGASLLLAIGGALTYTSNVIVAIDPTAVPAGLIHLWSLAAEEQFYVIWPLLLLFLSRIGRRALSRGLALLLAVALLYRLVLVLRGASFERLYYGPDTHADPLLIGCLVACWFRDGRLPRLIGTAHRRGVAGCVVLAVVVGAAVFLDRVPQRISYIAQLPTLFAGLAALLVLCAALGGSVITQALTTAPIAFLGRISYSLYLWHLPLLVALGVHRHFGVRFLVAIGLSLALATLSRYLVELPILRRGGQRHAASRTTQQPAPMVAPVG